LDTAGQVSTPVLNFIAAICKNYLKKNQLQRTKSKHQTVNFFVNYESLPMGVKLKTNSLLPPSLREIWGELVHLQVVYKAF